MNYLHFNTIKHCGIIQTDTGQKRIVLNNKLEIAIKRLATYRFHKLIPLKYAKAHYHVGTIEFF